MDKNYKLIVIEGVDSSGKQTQSKLLKENLLNRRTKRLYLDEVLVALAITATTNAMAQRALEQLPKLAGAQLHSSVMLHPDDINTLKKLKIDVTTETNQDTKLLQR